MNWKALLGDRRVQIALVVVAISLGFLFLRDGNPTTVDANFGIEFIGGVRIPITLEHAATADEMAVMVDTLKARVTKFGLTQASVRPLGSSQIIVEVPKGTESAIQSVESILKEQGRFEAVIDGGQALEGGDILSNAVGGSGGERIGTATRNANAAGGSWELDFAVSQAGAKRFSQAALGKGNFPVYMFLDRPQNAVLLMTHDDLGTNANALTTAQDALVKTNDNIELKFIDELGPLAGLSFGNKTTIVIGQADLDNNTALFNRLKELGFLFGNETAAANSTQTSKRVLVRAQTDMTPEFTTTGLSGGGLNRWRAIGLISAPVLSPTLANGYTSQFYTISGSAAGKTPAEADTNARTELRELKSVVSGGRLPISTFVGSAYSVSAPLGEQFLSLSMVALVIAVLAVSVLIIQRYKRLSIAIPVILTNVCEVIILSAIMGTISTIDLGAMAGIITLIGDGVNDQIIIMDELLRRKARGELGQNAAQPAPTAAELKAEANQPIREAKAKLKKAFSVVLTVAGLAMASQVPLLLSGIVEITGFALSSIIGLLVGYLITRQAFGAFIEHMYGEKLEH
ncbi:Protein-export membrane protein SecD [uncultured archaeon]|nr:Protein-export membrane protein SecD [uncultured archaeon]